MSQGQAKPSQAMPSLAGKRARIVGSRSKKVLRNPYDAQLMWMIGVQPPKGRLDA